jgi:hypothetical protein
MRDLVEAARAVLDTVPMHDETCACQYSPTQPADCCDSSKALAALRAALAAHEARPAVEWVETVNDDGDARPVTRPHFTAEHGGLQLRVQWDADQDGDAGGEAWRAWTLDMSAPRGQRVKSEVRCATLDLAKLAAETAAGVGR